MEKKILKKDLDTLVLSGGGIKCISILGSLSYLNELGIVEEGFKNFKNIYYTSGSSIFTLPILLGYTIEETTEIFKKIDYSFFDFNEDISINNLFKNLGF